MKADVSYMQVKFGLEVRYDEPEGENPQDFFDREREKREALDLLFSPESRRPVWLVGERRIGKSSTLELLLNKCQKQGNFIAFRLPWQIIDSAKRFFAEFLAALEQAADPELKDIPITDEEIRDSQAFWRAFQSRKQALPDKTVVVGVDEFDGILKRCQNDSDRQEIYATVYRLIEEPSVKIILVTSRDPEKVQDQVGSPFSLRGGPISLAPFTDTDFQSFVRSLAPSLSESEVQELGRLSGNWPYYAKAVLYHFLQEMSRRDMRWAQERAIESVGTTCQHLYKDHWNREERQALLLLARKRVLEAEEFDRLDPPLRDAFRGLVKRGYLAEEEGRYRFRVGLIEAWLQSWVSRETEEHVLGIPALLSRLRSGRDPWRREEDEIHVRITKDEMRRRGF